MVVPPKHPKIIIFVGKPMVVGYHHFRKPPLRIIGLIQRFFSFFSKIPSLGVKSSDDLIDTTKLKAKDLFFPQPTGWLKKTTRGSYFQLKYTWMFPKIVGFPPKASILIDLVGCSIIFTIHFGPPLFLGNTHIIDMFINSLHNSCLKIKDFFVALDIRISLEKVFWMSIIYIYMYIVIWNDLETPLKTASFLVVAWLVVLNNRGLAACAKGSQWLRSLQALQMFAKATVENRVWVFLGDVCETKLDGSFRTNKWHGKERYV